MSFKIRVDTNSDVTSSETTKTEVLTLWSGRNQLPLSYGGQNILWIKNPNLLTFTTSEGVEIPLTDKVTGPNSSTNRSIPVWDGTSGNALLSTEVTISLAGDITSSGTIHSPSVFTSNLSSDTASVTLQKPITASLLANINQPSATQVCNDTNGVADGPLNITITAIASNIRIVNVPGSTFNITTAGFMSFVYVNAALTFGSLLGEYNGSARTLTSSGPTFLSSCITINQVDNNWIINVYKGTTDWDAPSVVETTSSAIPVIIS